MKSLIQTLIAVFFATALLSACGQKEEAAPAAPAEEMAPAAPAEEMAPAAPAEEPSSEPGGWDPSKGE